MLGGIPPLRLAFGALLDPLESGVRGLPACEPVVKIGDRRNCPLYALMCRWFQNSGQGQFRLSPIFTTRC